MTETSQKEILEAFLDDYKKVVSLLATSREEEAKAFFNESMIPQYRGCVEDNSSIIRAFLTYFIELDEFFNNSTARYLGVASKQKILNYFDDFLEEVEKVKKEAKS